MDAFIAQKVVETLTSPTGILALLSGTVIGYIVGIIPVIGQGFGLIVLLPLAFFIRPEIAFIVYASMFGGADQGGSVTSILMNIPGNVANITTVLDGYPMARSGQAGRAIGISAGCSIMGTVIGIATLIAVIPLMSAILHGFGSREYFLTVIMGMVISSLTSGEGSFIKGLVGGCLGMLCSFIGDDSISGHLRYTGGIGYFSGGMPLIAFVIGLYALGELLMLQGAQESIAPEGFARATFSDTYRGVWESFKAWGAVLRASVVGVLVGIVPGLGGAVAQYASYGVAKMMARDRSTFGKGNPIGVIASEAANNARDGSSMIPTLFLGIPGGPEMAILLGIFLIFGITPGPGMALNHMDLTWIIIVSLMLGNVLATIISFSCSPFLSKITTLPITLVNAFTLPVCMVALYSANNEIWDFVVTGSLCVLGILMKRTGYPLGPLVIGYVLAPLAEKSFHATLQSGYYDPLNFFRSPLALGLTAVILGGLIVPAVLAVKKRYKKNRPMIEKPDSANGPKQIACSGNRCEGILVATIFVVAAILFGIRAPLYGLMESGLWPLVITIGMLVAASSVFVSELRSSFPRKEDRILGFLGRSDVLQLAQDWGKLLPVLGWLILHIALSIVVGLHVANLLSVFVLLRFLGHLNLAKSVIWSLIVHACIYLFFCVGLKILLWPGIVPTLIPDIIGGGRLNPFF